MLFPNYKTCRKISGLLFLVGNFTLLSTNFINPNYFQFISGLLFITCSVGLILSAHHHRFLFYCAAVTIIAYTLTALSTTGNGTPLAHMAIIAGIISGVLMLRSAFQRETGRQMQLPRALSWLDLYPMASAGLLEGICCICVVIGGLINHDYRLALSVSLWVIAHGFLIASDEYLRARLTRIKP